MALGELLPKAHEALKRHITAAQVGRLRRVLGLPRLKRLHAVLNKRELERLEEALQQHAHLIVHRGPKRLYIQTPEEAAKNRERTLQRRPWEKANGTTRLARPSPSPRGD